MNIEHVWKISHLGASNDFYFIFRTFLHSFKSAFVKLNTNQSRSPEVLCPWMKDVLVQKCWWFIWTRHDPPLHLIRCWLVRLVCFLLVRWALDEYGAAEGVWQLDRWLVTVLWHWHFHSSLVFTFLLPVSLASIISDPSFRDYSSLLPSKGHNPLSCE